MNDMLAMPSAKNIKQLTFNDYYFRLKLLALAVFEWKGLPNGLDPMYIEKYLLTEGRCMFFKDKKLGWIVTKCTEKGGVNHFDEPIALRPSAPGAYVNLKNYTPEVDCVYIKNNAYCLPTTRTLRMYAARLTEIQRTADVNIIAQKTPLIVKGNDKQIKSLRQVIRSFIGDEPVSLIDKQLDISEMKVLNTAAPVVFDKLTIEKNKMWNECMTFLGINNANTDKRERLVDDEVQANNEQIELSAHVMLQSRERAAEQISEMIGSKVTVCIRDANTGAVEPAATHKTLQPEGGDE